jgi:hypothetical protein
MKTLIRLGAVLGAVALCAPALACSEMQQTTAQKPAEQQPAVASGQDQKTPTQTQTQTQSQQKKAAKADTKVAKAQAPKPAPTN